MFLPSCPLDHTSHGCAKSELSSVINLSMAPSLHVVPRLHRRTLGDEVRQFSSLWCYPAVFAFIFVCASNSGNSHGYKWNKMKINMSWYILKSNLWRLWAAQGRSLGGFRIFSSTFYLGLKVRSFIILTVVSIPSKSLLSSWLKWW